MIHVIAYEFRLIVLYYLFPLSAIVDFDVSTKTKGVDRSMTVAKSFNHTRTPNARDTDKGMTLKIPFNPI
jgi:hypothetical protein